VSTFELRIGRDSKISQHVVLNVGFVVVGTVSQRVAGTGETFECLRCVLARDQLATSV
jgi:hypothetical protein